MQKILILADNLREGAACLLEQILLSFASNRIYNSQASLHVYLCKTAVISLPINDSITYSYRPAGVRFSLYSRYLEVIANADASFIVNLTNFPLPTRLLGKINHEICLLHNAYLFDEPFSLLSKHTIRQHYYTQFLLRLLLKRAFFKLSLLLCSSSRSIFMVQTNHMQKLVRRALPARFLIRKIHYHTVIPVQANDSYALGKRGTRLNLSRDDNHWLYPAAAVPQKNHELLLRIMSRMDKNRFRFKLYITIEKNQPLCKRILTLIDTYKLNDYVVNIGWLPPRKLGTYLKEVDGLLFMSDFESLALPLHEAVALSKPLICSSSPVAKEILGSSVNLLDPRTREGATRLVDYLSQPDLQSMIPSFANNVTDPFDAYIGWYL